MSILPFFGFSESQDQDAETRAQDWLDRRYPEEKLQDIFDSAAKNDTPYHYIKDNFMAIDDTQAFADFQKKIADRAGGYAKASFNSTVGMEGRVDTITFWTEKPNFMSRVASLWSRPSATFLG